MNPRSVTIVVALCLVAAIFAAPVLPGLYLAFAAVCHQAPARCFEWLGHPLPVCARCLGIYAGALAAGLFPLRAPAGVLSILAALNGVDWILEVTNNETRFLMALFFCWAGASRLIEVASTQRAAGN